MTITNTTLASATFSGNGATVDFATGFQFIANGDLLVTVTVDATGVETVKTITTHYTVVGAGVSGGGTVTFLTAPASGESINIQSNIDYDQQTDYLEGGSFAANTHEDALDKLTKAVQQVKEITERSVQIPIAEQAYDTQTDAPAALEVLRANAAADGFEWVDPVDAALSGTVTPTDGDFLVGDGSDWVGEGGATARTSMGLGTMSVQAASAVTITGGSVVGITDIIVGDGGTGVSTLTDGGILLGSGTSPITAMGVLADSEMIVGDGTTDPVAESGATLRASIGVTIGSHVQAWDAQLDDIAALAVTDSNIIVGDGANWVAESGATARASLGLTIGTDVQAYDAELAAIASVTSAADKLPYFTGSGTATVTDLTTFGRSIIDDANEATFKATVNLEIGTDVQAWDTQLDDIAALAVTNSNFIVGDGANWVAESGATARTSLGVAIGSDVQAYDADLQTIADAGAVNFGAFTSFEIPNGTGPTTNAAGEIALDTDGDGASITTGVLQIYDGTQNTFAVSSTNYPSSDNDVAAYDSASNSVVWQAQTGGGGGLTDIVDDVTPQLGGMLDVNTNAIGDGTRELITFTEDGSAVNQVNIENEATGSGPIISAAGGDANIDLNINGKATGNVVLRDGTDVTKDLVFELAGATTAKTTTLAVSQTDDRTVTLPDATDTLVGKATTDTFTNKTFDANGTGNSLSNVDIADLANGTDGELITWDSAGAPAAVAVGTAAQVLTSNGVGAAPTFQAAGGSDWVLLETQTASTSASIDFTTGIDSTYAAYVFVLSNIVAGTDDQNLNLRISDDGGSTWEADATDYSYGIRSRTMTISVTSAHSAHAGKPEMKIIGTTYGLGTGTNEQASAVIWCHQPSSANFTHFNWRAAHYSSLPGGEHTTGAGMSLAAVAVDGVQFIMESGNIASGTFHMYGVKAA